MSKRVVYRLARSASTRDRIDQTLAFTNYTVYENEISIEILRDWEWPAPALDIADRWIGVLGHEHLHALFFQLGDIDPEGQFDAWLISFGTDGGTPEIGRTGLPRAMEGQGRSP